MDNESVEAPKSIELLPKTKNPEAEYMERILGIDFGPNKPRVAGITEYKTAVVDKLHSKSPYVKAIALLGNIFDNLITQRGSRYLRGHYSAAIDTIYFDPDAGPMTDQYFRLHENGHAYASRISRSEFAHGVTGNLSEFEELINKRVRKGEKAGDLTEEAMLWLIKTEGVANFLAIQTVIRDAKAAGDMKRFMADEHADLTGSTPTEYTDGQPAGPSGAYLKNLKILFENKIERYFDRNTTDPGHLRRLNLPMKHIEYQAGYAALFRLQQRNPDMPVAELVDRYLNRYQSFTEFADLLD